MPKIVGYISKTHNLSIFIVLLGINVNCTKNGFGSVPKCQQVDITLDCLYLSKYVRFLAKPVFMVQKDGFLYI